jgi:hypothetical protein
MAVTDLFFSLVASQGIAIIFSVTFLASLAVPVQVLLWCLQVVPL